MQAQDYAGAKWSIGLRLPSMTEVAVEQAIANRQIIRTWPMRGTLHFVPTADARWMLDLTTPRIIAGAATRQARLELSGDILQKSADVFVTALQEHKALTRKDMMIALEQNGISTKNQRGYHLLWWAAQKGFICIGPLQGKQPTFVLLDDWAPPSNMLTRDAALAELAKRYFTSHGPATLRDFRWWSGLTAIDARTALAMIQADFDSAVVAGNEYWFPPNLSHDGDSSVHLLPGFDEYLLGYTDRSAVLAVEHAAKIIPGNNGMFMPTIIIDGQIVGIWKRTITKRAVVIQLTAFEALKPTDYTKIAAIAARYGEYLGLPVDLRQ